jgi:signal transduction histidine kinase
VKQTVPYALLGILAVAVVTWQALEHGRVRAAAQAALAARAQDMAVSVSVVLRSQGRFGWVQRERIETALEALTRSTEPISVALLDADGAVTVSAGDGVREDYSRLLEKRAHWERDRATFVNVVALGPQALEGDEPGPRVAPPPDDERGRGPGAGQGLGRWDGGRDGGREGPREFRRPPWLGEAEFRDLISARGVHWFVITMPTAATRLEITRDLGMRVVVGMAAVLACAALGLAWRSFQHGADLRVRLARADELTRHLRDLNLAAAGLVHETKNPLNVIRGLAQMIERQDGAPSPVREKALTITEEADRVAGRLNLFLDYARPLEPRPRSVALGPLVRNIQSILEPDLEDKGLALEINDGGITVLADEGMLRQALFNLLLNAVQSAPEGGRIAIRAGIEPEQGGFVEVIDDGPGVPPDQREEVFKPYFTTSNDGAGLGLAIVRQIAVAHGWEAGCLPTGNGARFRIAGMNTGPAGA